MVQVMKVSANNFLEAKTKSIDNKTKIKKTLQEEWN